MGSYTSLKIDRLEIAGGKNEFIPYHGELFSKANLTVENITNNDGTTESRPIYKRKLIDIKKRLELSGYSLKNCRSLYENSRKSFVDENSEPDDYFFRLTELNFDVYFKVMSNVDIQNIDVNIESYSDASLKMHNLQNYKYLSPEYNKFFPFAEIASEVGDEFFGQLDPYLELRLYIENPKNHCLELIWDYYDVVAGGWIDENKIHASLEINNSYLIITEGSSDSFIIKKAFELLMPDLVDYFKFIDMKENYPFTGIGSLYNFCKGLIKVGAEGNKVILFDNDVEGSKIYELVKKLNSRLTVMKLPNLEDLNFFRTAGPSGERVENINGLASSIECFLDFKYKVEFEPCVRWTSYIESENKYQGSLIKKDDYVRLFKNVSIDSKYDFKKLEMLLNEIYCICTNIAPDVLD